MITTFTREIAEHSTPDIEGLLRRFITEDTSGAIDAVLVSNAAATAIAPAGIRNGVTVDHRDGGRRLRGAGRRRQGADHGAGHRQQRQPALRRSG